MRLSTRAWFLLSLMLFVAAAFFWRLGDERPTSAKARQNISFTPNGTKVLHQNSFVTNEPSATAQKTNPAFQYRLSNTSESIGQLVRNDKAILLRNALIDTSSSQPLAIPEHLRAKGDPGSYIVQARGVIDNEFRKNLKEVGAEIISYIPNNAYLVRASEAASKKLAGLPKTQAVLPFEPYYKLPTKLLEPAVNKKSLPKGTPLKVTAFPQDKELAKKVFGAPVEQGPFGPIFITSNDFVATAQLPFVQEIEVFQRRTLMNDLTREKIGVSTDTINATNYLGLTGANVLVNVNDTGIDATHPDLANRVTGDVAVSVTDLDGHGTHVAGVIASSGSNSPVVFGTNITGSVPGASFRGKAPNAKLFVMPIDLLTGPFISDQYLQETAAKTNAFISNNSWGYLFDKGYNSACASYDQAVRDALPSVTGMQPMLYVFAAGNSGLGNNDGSGGDPESITAPATAKNVIAVGSSESLRLITEPLYTYSTNIVSGTNVITTNTIAFFRPYTDDPSQVSSFSSRGNVGIGIEGEFGRFKPDVVAPGAFIVSTRSKDWKLTNDYPTDSPFFQALSNLNSRVQGSQGELLYRYETGTSMSAPAVSGVLALMKEFFEQKLPVGLRRTNSPALMKALLINGARSVGPQYSFQVNNFINYQGWGLVNLTNSIPGALTNSNPAAWPVQFIDQSPTNALATGETFTQTINVSAAARSFPLRFTLVWTDPPGNPVASQKLVNDLDLIVSTTITNSQDPTEVITTDYHGNNFPGGSDYTTDTGTNEVRDVVNNVENVYLNPQNAPLEGTYTVRVVARRVNVNAVTSHPNGVVQDFALVVSTGDSTLTAPFTLTNPTTSVSGNPNVTTITNGLGLYNQRVGANAPLLASTNGSASQWNFYIFTNNFTSFSISGTNGSNIMATNVAFATFFPPNLSGVNGLHEWGARVDEADLDLYVSTNAALLVLDPAAINGADKSTNRGGSEAIVYTNSTLGQVYYIGVKSEDQQAAEYGFFGIATDQVFSALDSNGDLIIRGVPAPVAIPDESSLKPKGIQVHGFVSTPLKDFKVRRVVVTNSITHELIGDLFGVLHFYGDGSPAFSVLNNHTLNNNRPSGTFNFIYDDSDQGDVMTTGNPNDVVGPTDFPGSLRNFVSKKINTGSHFLMNMVDNTPLHVGTNDSLFIRIEPQSTNALGGNATILANRWYYDFIEVPAEATNLQVIVTFPTGRIETYLRKEEFPTQATYDKKAIFNPPGGILSLGLNDSPSLSPGLYIVGFFNPTATSVALNYKIKLEYDLNPAKVPTFTSTGITPLKDDAVTTSTLYVGEDRRIVSTQVGIRIAHPRVSDLSLRLVSPQGTKILLAEDRGRTTGTGFGVSGVASTNNVPVLISGFESDPAGKYTSPSSIDGWSVISTNVIRLINDSMVANSGNQYLEIRKGKISRTLPTQAGAKYTLTYAYRQTPGLNPVSWWKAENNANDSSDGNNGILVGGINYAGGEVGEAFNLDGLTGHVLIPAATNLNVVSFTMDAWINPTNILTNAPLFEYGRSVIGPSGVHFWIDSPTNYSGGALYANIRDIKGSNHIMLTATNKLTTNTWQHVALTYNSTNGDANIYLNGTNLLYANLGIFTPETSYDLNLGYRPVVSLDVTFLPFHGRMDEAAIYNMALSSSQIMDIYLAGSLGKCGTSTPPTNCPSAAQIKVAGVTTNSLITNLGWRTNTIVFTATSSGTPITAEGIDSGILLDSFVLKEEQINPGITYAIFTENTNYYPEMIKFAQPPFGTNTNVVVSANVFQSGFEPAVNGRYPAGSIVDSWSVSNANVYVMTDPTFADTENNSLALSQGAIGRSFATQVGQTYTLKFAYRQGISSLINWWPGNSNTMDTIGGQNGTLVNGANYATGIVSQAFNFNGVNDYVNFGTNAGNFGTNDFTVDFWMKTSASSNAVDAVIGKHSACGSSSGWDIRISGGAGFGKLAPSLYDGANSALFTGQKIINDGNWHHVALVRQGTISRLYTDGSLDGEITTAAAPFVSNNANFLAGDNPCVGIDGTARFKGQLDEIGFHNKAISTNEIYSIYLAGSAGRCSSINPPITCPPSLTRVGVGNTTNLITGGASWKNYSSTFTSSGSGTSSVNLSGLQSGMWLDTFSLSQVSGGNYYLPEESLSILNGENALGDWKLEIWDNREGATINANLISWQLQLTLAPTNANGVITLTNGVSYTGAVGNQIKYFIVDVPISARYATNILTSVGDLILLGDRSGVPVGNPSSDDYYVDNNGAGLGEYLLLSTMSPPSAPLQPGGRYYLGVQNANPNQTNVFTIRVDFDKVDTLSLSASPLSSGGTFTTTIPPGVELNYFHFDVALNAASAAFEILNPSDDVNLVARRGSPLPNRASYDYQSANPGTNNELILVTTNSPVPLLPGRWYLGVYNNSTNTVTYSIRVTQELIANIIDLMDGIAIDFVSAPANPLTNFFRFVITQTNSSALFELYNLSGNVDLLARRGALPSLTQYDFRSQNTGNSGEQIVLNTNSLVPDLNGEWFLGVPDNETFDVTYTIRAVVSTNGMLISGQPPRFNSAPVVTSGGNLGMSWNSVAGQHYEIQASTDLISWTTIDTVTASGSTTTYTTTAPIDSSLYRFYRVQQVP